MLSGAKWLYTCVIICKNLERIDGGSFVCQFMNINAENAAR